MAEILANKLIGLLVTVGILAAVYFFAIKPILDTTNDAFDQFGGIGDSVESAFDDAGIGGVDLDSLDITTDEKAQRLLACVERAGQNVKQLQACQRRFQ